MLSNSKLGFGLMRLPKDKNGTIIQEKVNTMVDAFMKSGFTYFDTAYAYAGSEKAMKKALVERYPREAYTIADKLPAWKLKDENDVQIKEMKKQDKIKNIGFSFHDTPEFLDQVLTEHPEVDFVQLQLNYLDWNNGVIQSKKNLEIARKHHKPVVVMEPIKGGTLASFSEDIEQIYKNYDSSKSIASWALRFIASKEGVMTILSGMSTLEQMNDNLATMSNFVPLNNEEYKLVDQVTKTVLSKPTIPCTGCRYCTPGCPLNIQIPDLFTAYNSQILYGESSRYQTWYQDHTSNDHAKANQCLKCGQCEGVCPQHLKIISLLKEVSNVFDK